MLPAYPGISSSTTISKVATSAGQALPWHSIVYGNISARWSTESHTSIDRRHSFSPSLLS
jgi:hypothetical protein